MEAITSWGFSNRKKQDHILIPSWNGNGIKAQINSGGRRLAMDFKMIFLNVK